jgi:hypothetical protein
MNNKPVYSGILSEHQVTPRVRQEQIIFSGMNVVQTELYRRALYGLRIYPQPVIRSMTNAQRKKVTKKMKRTQRVLNLWKQQICNYQANRVIEKHFKMTPIVKKLLELHADYVDVEYVNNLSFSDLGVKRHHIIRKLIVEDILPKNFYDLTDEVPRTK